MMGSECDQGQGSAREKDQVSSCDLSRDQGMTRDQAKAEVTIRQPWAGLGWGCWGLTSLCLGHWWDVSRRLLRCALTVVLLSSA